jgi:glycerol-3-phosphate O-acyltransferase
VSVSGRPRPSYVWLHDNARHAIHVQETLDTTAEAMKDLIDSHDRMQRVPQDQKQKLKIAHIMVGERLKAYENVLRCLKHRSNSNKARLLNEITLVGESRFAPKIVC